MGKTLAEWTDWFIETAQLVMERCEPDAVSIFYQTDIKVDGLWVDKGLLCQLAARRAGIPQLWHKIVCRRPPGTISYGRPAYSHLLCFSRTVRLRAEASSADVLPGTGKMTWSRAMGLAACRLACRFVQQHTESDTIVDPFCGVGSILAVANALGMNALGVDTSRRRCQRARNLTISMDDLRHP